MRFDKLAGPALVLLPVLLLGAAADPGAGPEESAADDGEEAGAALLMGRPPALLLEGGTAAQRVPESTKVRYPPYALRLGQEGWVQMSFCVSPAGEVIDPVVEQSSGGEVFEQAALEGLRGSRFVPATWQGQPVLQCATRVLFQFKIAGQTGGRRSFLRAYRGVNALLSAGRLDEAQARLDTLRDEGGWNLYESSWLKLLQGNVQQRRGDLDDAMHSVSAGIAGKGKYIERQAYRIAVVQLFKLQVATRHYREALDTWADIQELNPALDDPEVDRLAREVRSRIDSPQYLEFSGEIRRRANPDEDHPHWQHALLRRKFGFEAVEGKVDEFELRCDWRRVRAPVSTEVVLELPASWGNCDVFVFGDAGAKLKLVEYPIAATSPTPPPGP